MRVSLTILPLLSIGHFHFLIAYQHVYTNPVIRTFYPFVSNTIAKIFTCLPALYFCNRVFVHTLQLYADITYIYCFFLYVVYIHLYFSLCVYTHRMRAGVYIYIYIYIYNVCVWCNFFLVLVCLLYMHVFVYIYLRVCSCFSFLNTTF